MSLEQKNKNNGKLVDYSDISSEELSEHSTHSRTRSRSMESFGRLYVGDLQETIKQRDLEKVFQNFSGLKEIWLSKIRPFFGFVVFEKKSQALAAMHATNGVVLGGRRIRVTPARPRSRGLHLKVFNSEMKCYECGNPGHFYRDCPDLRRRDRGFRRHSRRSVSPRRRNSSRRSERRYSRDRSPRDRRRRH